MPLTDTHMAILTAAAAHPENLAYPPARLPAGPRQKVAQALLGQNLVIAIRRPAEGITSLCSHPQERGIARFWTAADRDLANANTSAGRKSQKDRGLPRCSRLTIEGEPIIARFDGGPRVRWRPAGAA